MAANIINASEGLNAHIAILFIMMLRHGLSPDGMLHDTMVPIPTGRWTNVTLSNTFRTITVSRIWCKLLDVIVLNKEKDNICTSNLQLSFKLASTTLCTSKIHYVNNASTMYGLLHDASKAFDHVNYCKLFRTLLEWTVNVIYCRLLLNMYINHKLRIRWETTNYS